jgi:Fuc2NAc and GlcNAc transferase
MQPVFLVWSCAAVAGVSLALTWLARRYALRASLMDVPNLRSSHVQPTPRGGGVAIVGSFLAGLAVTYPIGGAPVDVLLVLIGGGGLIALTGFIDDHISMSAVSRLFIQFLAAAIAVFVVGGYFQAPAPVEFIDVLKGGLTAVGLVWLTNLYNFMDGIDGLAGVETMTVCGGAALFLAILGGQELVPACLFLAAAAAGFLAWNWPPARIFMGDVGSAFIGFSIGVLGLAASRSTEIPLWTWAILLGIFLVDATVTLLWRMGSGQRWYAAHRSHAYQRLARRLRGHAPVTLLVLAINVFWLTPLAYLAAWIPSRAPLTATLALLPLILVAWGLGAGRSNDH